MSNPEDQKSEEQETNTEEAVEQQAEAGPEADAEPAAEAAEGSADAADGSIESLTAKLEAASEEVTKFKDAALRAEAEMQNLRRRSSIDLENAHKFALEKFIQNLLPVIDSLEKGIESAEQASEEGSNKAIVEGIGLCHKMLLDVMGKEKCEVVNPEGEPFDPNLHQAMSMVENPDVEPNSVVAVVQKGYTLNGRLVRPAMVMVSKPAPKIDETA